MPDSTTAARRSELDRDDDPGLVETASELPLVVRAHLVTMVLYGVALAAVLFVLLFPRFVLFIAVLAAGAFGYVKLFGLVERKLAEMEGDPAAPVAAAARTGKGARPAKRRSRVRRTKKAAGEPAASSIPVAADGGSPENGPDAKSGS